MSCSASWRSGLVCAMFGGYRVSLLIPGPFCGRVRNIFFAPSLVKLFGLVPVGLLEISISFGPNWVTMAHKLEEGPVDFCLALRASAARRSEQTFSSHTFSALFLLILFFSALDWRSPSSAYQSWSPPV